MTKSDSVPRMPWWKKWSVVTVVFLLFMGAAAVFPGISRAAVTPSDVYSTYDLINRILDEMYVHMGMKQPDMLKKFESNISPMHVFQLSVATNESLIQLQKDLKMRPGFEVAAYPMAYVPEDVKRLGDWILIETIRTAEHMKVDNIPNDRRYFDKKIPTDVFGLVMDVLVKIRNLTGTGKISPNEVYGQMVRVVNDVKSILRNIDPHQRYRIDVLTSPDGLRPSDVFSECFNIRKDLNQMRETFGMPVVPVPENIDMKTIQPEDVFVQTQILIAEMNNIKVATNTMTVTPIAIPVDGKTPSDVHQQAILAKYLINQVLFVQDMMKKLEKN